MHALKENVKKGFTFTLVTLAVFALLLSMMLSYFETSSASRPVARDVEKLAYLRDDVSDDFQEMLGVRVYALRGVATEVHFADEFPARIANIEKEIKEHARFLEDYAISTNSKMTLDVSEMERAPRVVVRSYNITYAYGNLEKKNLSISSRGAKGFIVSLNLDGECAGECVSGNWKWKNEDENAGAGLVAVEFKIRDRGGKTLDVFGKTSGAVDAAKQNKITIKTTTGEVVISISGESDAPEINVGVEGVRAATDIALIFSEDKEVKARVPIRARIEAGDASSDSELTIYEN